MGQHKDRSPEADARRAAWKPSTKISRKARRIIRALPDGWVWNPLSKYPRNHACLCGSGKKFKRCCLGTQSPIIQAEDYAKFLDIVKQAKA